MIPSEEITHNETNDARELSAFGAVDFNWTRQVKSVWHDPPYHVPELHKKVVDDIVSYFLSKTVDVDPADEPLGRAIVGAAGFGKTHLIGELRRRVWEKKCWFVLLDFSGIKDFWPTVALGFRNSLQARTHDGNTQCQQLVVRLAQLLGIEQRFIPTADRWRNHSRDLMIELVRFFTRALAHKYPGESLAHLDAMTALVLLNSEDLNCQEIADLWLQGGMLEHEDAHEFGFKEGNSPEKVVESLSWIMSRVAPTLIGVDQIDAIVTASKHPVSNTSEGSEEQKESQSIVEALAQGLMDLHEAKRRAVVVISSLERTWQILQDKPRVPMQHRYLPPNGLSPFSVAETARAVIMARLATAYAKAGFVAPSAVWPFTDNAFKSALGLSPRELLMACYQHQQACIAGGKVTICDSLGKSTTGGDRPVGTAHLDEIYHSALDDAVITNLLDTSREDDLWELLDRGLRLLVQHYHLPRSVDADVLRDPDVERPALHGRLSFTFVDEGGREEHYCFRALAHSHATAFQARLKAAITASGIDRALKFRHLFILRREPPPSGPKTADLVNQFKRLGGRFLAPTDDDLRTLVALAAMDGRELDGFERWLQMRRPLFTTQLFGDAGLCPPPFLAGSGRAEPGSSPGTATVGWETKGGSDTQAPRVIPVGRRDEGGVPGAEVTLPAELLRRHIAVLAGSGSGKTVLLRRMIEESVLLGIPAIVLDPNNDLSRLGDSWPVAPKSWTEEDVAKAARYHEHADVVIWTPGVSEGNPMSLKLLPDFATIDNEDERERAVQMAFATLLPLVPGSGVKATLKQGVLADTLRHFAASGGGDLLDLIRLLAGLPKGVSNDPGSQKLAQELAAQLNAAVAIDPLLKPCEETLGPGTLLQGPGGKTRVSVINLGGLSDEARDSFVNRLQMSLFTFIKRNPSATGSLYVIDEAQNFAPSERSTACRESALQLAAQARKYGLGMMFATQTPKGIHNKIVSNCTTHVYGRMSSPAALVAIRELMAAKGGAADDVGGLAKGEFYFSTEGSGRPYKIRTPMCLSWHTEVPPTHDEVIAKARANRP